MQENETTVVEKIVTIRQLWEMLKTHICTVSIIFLFGMMLFVSVVTHHVGSVIFSIVASLIYFFSIYQRGYETAKRDMKSYTEEVPYIWKGVLLPLGILVIGIIVYVLYYVSWRFMSIDGTIVGISGLINNIIFIMWSFPFTGFMELKNGYMSESGFILTFGMPFLASFLGYLAGYKNYDISVTINKLIYAKKEN